VALQVISRKVPKRLSLLINRTNSCSVIRSAKFIGEHWFAAGLENGWVLVYSYTTTTDTNTTEKAAAVKELQAHPGKPVTSLAVHPTKPFLLTASSCDTSIKLWNWNKDWMCAQTFDNLDGGSVQEGLTFDATSDINTSSSASDCCTKVCCVFVFGDYTNSSERDVVAEL
jgi:WD40 repeat protein